MSRVGPRPLHVCRGLWELPVQVASAHTPGTLLEATQRMASVPEGSYYGGDRQIEHKSIAATDAFRGRACSEKHVVWHRRGQEKPYVKLHRLLRFVNVEKRSEGSARGVTT